jgi:hypothetical protein
VYLSSTADEEVTVTLGVPGATNASVGTSLERQRRALPVAAGALRVPAPACGFVAVSVDRESTSWGIR